MGQPPPPPPEERTVVEDEVDPRYPGRRVVVDEPLPPRPNFWPWLLATLLAALAIVFFFLWWNERGDETEAAPNLVGLREVEARREAASGGFALTVVRRPSTSRLGTVLQQGPNPGAELEEGARILAVVSSGRREVDVPQLVGVKLEAARRLAETAGLKFTARAVPSNKPKDTVLSQNPQPGGAVAAGSEIFVTVSRGPSQVSVPDVTGRTVEEATRQLTNIGLVPTVIRVPSEQPDGTVIAQDPRSGEKLKPGATVRLNVSLGTTTGETVTETVTTATTETVETVP
jgi:beta-lactam-binding protein with PASTA domain